MIILIDQYNIKTKFGINVLDWTPLYGGAGQTTSEYTWHNKSGVEKNVLDSRFDVFTVQLPCVLSASSELKARQKLRDLIDYLYNKGAGTSDGISVLSLQDGDDRAGFLIHRSASIAPTVSVMQNKTLFHFLLALEIVNPRAVEIPVTDVVTNVYYGNTVISKIFWGDGSSELLLTAKEYSHTYDDGVAEHMIMIDIDSQDYISETVSQPILSVPLVFETSWFDGTCEIQIITNYDWEITDIPGWLYFINTRGQIVTSGIGSDTVTAVFSTNPSLLARTKTILFSTQSNSTSFTITQSGYEERTTGLDSRTTGLEERTVNS